jgi:hypothetical protein
MCDLWRSSYTYHREGFCCTYVSKQCTATMLWISLYWRYSFHDELVAPIHWGSQDGDSKLLYCMGSINWCVVFFFCAVGENSQRLTDGFALGMVGVWTADIWHSSTKGQAVWCKSGLQRDSAHRGASSTTAPLQAFELIIASSHKQLYLHFWAFISIPIAPPVTVYCTDNTLTYHSTQIYSLYFSFDFLGHNC